MVTSLTLILSFILGKTASVLFEVLLASHGGSLSRGVLPQQSMELETYTQATANTDKGLKETQHRL